MSDRKLYDTLFQAYVKGELGDYVEFRQYAPGNRIVVYTKNRYGEMAPVIALGLTT